MFTTIDVDHDADQGVDRSAEEDGRDDDEEVLDHEPGDGVGVLFRREDTKDVADDFHDCADQDGREVPGSVEDDEVEMGDGGDEEEDDAEDADDDGGCVSSLDQLVPFSH